MEITLEAVRNEVGEANEHFEGSVLSVHDPKERAV